MTNAPLVSIIIPTYNRAHLIGETLDSVLAQTYTNWECIVVDDGSTDNTAEVMAIYCTKDARFQYHHRPADRLPGGNAARNYGFELSKGEYVNWFDSDDVMLPEFLTLKVDAFKKNKRIQMVICSGSYVDENLKNPKPIDLNITSFLFKDYVLWRLKIVTNNVLFKKSFFNNVDLFNDHILRGQEAELFSRLFFKLPEEKYVLLNKSLFFYRQHSSTKTSKNESYNSKYKTSQIYNCLANFKKSQILQDDELRSFCFKGMLHYFFESLKNSDSLNSKYILNELLPLIKPLNYSTYLEIKSLGYLFIGIGRGSYKIHQRWNQIQLCIL